MRYFIRFSYDGSKFYGFQRQKDKISVQESLEEALTILDKNSVEVKGAGRTDVGVHALAQCAHFDMQNQIPPERLLRAINRIVVPYIYVLECKIVNNDFHARHNALGKKYVYKIWTGDYSPLLYDYYLMYDKPLNLKKLEECAKIFIGKHDFHNFVSGKRKNYDNEIFDISFKSEANFLEIHFYGKGFYRYMVRNLVGAMLDYNENKCEIYDIKRMVMESYFHKSLRCAKANGLYLEGVLYEDK